MQVAEASATIEGSGATVHPLTGLAGVRPRRVGGRYLVGGVTILHQDNN